MSFSLLGEASLSRAETSSKDKKKSIIPAHEDSSQCSLLFSSLMVSLRSLSTVAEGTSVSNAHSIQSHVPSDILSLYSIVTEAVGGSASILSLGPQESLVKIRKMELESCLHISNIVNISFDQMFIL